MSTKKKIFVSVSNDLVTDQRVKKVCSYLNYHGFEVNLIGRKLKSSLSVNDRPYATKRFRLLFNRGPFFYAALNTRLFFYLLFKKTDWLLANDLDTLPANYYASKFKRNCKLVYDTHEIFCEVPELQNNNFKKRIWEYFERKIFPKLKKVYTVNQSIADYYYMKYKVKPIVVRNISERNKLTKVDRKTLGLPEQKFIVIIQGSGINRDRGNEEILEAFKHLSNDFLLVIVGSGDVIPKLKIIAEQPDLNNKILFFDKRPFHELMQITMNCDAGISMDKDSNLNYKYSLPNKIFDFMHAGIPVIASDLPEVKKIVIEHKTGIICSSHQPEQIAQIINGLKQNESLHNDLKKNCIEASKTLNWETEVQQLNSIYEINV